MKIIALSGGVAAGKDFVADIFAKHGASLFDADKIVHEIFENDKNIFEIISKDFPQAIENNKINRKILGKIAFNNKTKLQILEEAIHPLVRKKYQEFLEKNKREIIVLNIPLLLEKGGYKYDSLVAIITDLEVREERYIKREIKENNHDKDLLKQKFHKIVANQVSDELRISKADFIIKGDDSVEKINSKVTEIIGAI